MPKKNLNLGRLNVEISMVSLAKITLIILAAISAYYFWNILLLVFVSLIIAASLNTLTSDLEKIKIPRALGVVIIYLIFFTVMIGAAYLVIPLMNQEIGNLAADFPYYLEKIGQLWNNFANTSIDQVWLSRIQQSLNSIQFDVNIALNSVFNLVGSFSGGFIYFLAALVMIYFFTVKEEKIKLFFCRIFMPGRQDYCYGLLSRLQQNIGYWLRGQLLLCVILFLLSWIGLSILGIKYALILGIFSGVTEFLPYLGPLLGGLPAILIAFGQSPILGLLTLLLFFIFHQSENYFIAPKVLSRAVGISPVFVIISVLIGAKIAGLIGVILAVPVATIIKILLDDYSAAKNSLI